MNGLIIGKRIPIGAAVGGALTAAALFYNMGVPVEQQLPMAAVNGLSIALSAIVQVFVVNCFGVTNVRPSKD